MEPMSEPRTTRSDAAPVTFPEGLLVSCPDCRSLLDAAAGAYACRRCGIAYPVVDGVLRMTPPLSGPERQTKSAFDFEHRRYTAARYLRIAPSLCEDWLNDVRLPRDYFRGKTVLDLGCGSGRWTYAMASLGANVVAVDFSDAAVEITRQVTQGIGSVTVVQASLFRLPFAPGQFDFVVSWGVLHHTRDTVEAFRAVAPLVRPGGRLHIMVYERRNPIKVAGTELLRMALRRLSPEARYRFCRRLVVRNRLLFQLVRGFVACVPVANLSESWDEETAQFGLYDWYSPRYNHLHSVAEARGWFADMGFEDVTVTTPIKYTQALDVWRYGECGGSISLHGRRGEASGVGRESHAKARYDAIGV